jgi:phosphonate transport system substrate-binding protein
MKIFKYLFMLMPLMVFLTACDQQPEQQAGPVYKKISQTEKPVYRLAIHPLHNPRKLTEAYQPLIDHLNENIEEVQFELEASRDYQAYEAKFRDRKPQLILPNPWQTLEAMKAGYKVIAMAGDAEDFKGIFIVRRDSGIETPADLKGKIVCYPSHTALAACIMPQRYLHDNGIDIHKDIENRYVGSQESSIMNALLGEVAAGATWPPPWRLFKRDRPEDAAKLKVIWETPSLMNNSVMVRDDIPDNIVSQVSSLITVLHETEKGRNILNGMETARFYSANDESYKPVREFVDEFEKDVRPVEQP